MALVDSVKDFWVKKILMPKVFRIDIPGYVTGKFYTLEGQTAFVRNIFMPENFFVILENKVSVKLGKDGSQKLYAASKKFGYGFATSNRLPKANPEFSIDLVTRFFESLYAEELKVKVDVKKRYVELQTDDLFVTRMNGGGESITLGGFTGVCGYIFGDFKNIDGGVSKTGENYNIICGPSEELGKNNVEHFEFKGDIPSFDKRYVQFNTPTQKIPQNSFSLEKLMKSSLFSYEKGELTFSLPGIRFAPVEISLIYLIGMEIDNQIIYEASKEAFQKISESMKKQANPYLFVSNILTALGYGVVTVEKMGGQILLSFEGFPWYTGCEVSTFPLLRGMVEGFLVGQKADKLNVVIKDNKITDNKLVVLISVTK